MGRVGTAPRTWAGDNPEMGCEHIRDFVFHFFILVKYIQHKIYHLNLFFFFFLRGQSGEKGQRARETLKPTPC